MTPLADWWFAPARWWEFWLPQSGAPGGLILGLIICSVLSLALWGTFG